jgi:hypothetical protein
LTFDWSNIDFLSYLENPVALSYISEVHTLLRKLSHTHTHTLHELTLLLKNFYFQGNFCACLLWTLNYILVYFWNAIWLFYQLFIQACSEANVRRFVFSIFPSAFQLLVWSIQTDMFLRPDTLSYVDLLSDNMPSGRYVPRQGESFLLSLPNTYTLLLLALSCCVVCVFSRTDPEILEFFTHLFSFPSISFWLSLFS